MGEIGCIAEPCAYQCLVYLGFFVCPNLNQDYFKCTFIINDMSMYRIVFKLSILNSF